MEMRLLIFVALILGFTATSGSAQTTDWAPLKQIADPRDSSVTITIAGNPHFGFKTVWVSSGITSDGRRDLSRTRVVFSQGGYFGMLIVADGLGGSYFYDITASSALKQMPYWKDREIDVETNGTFPFYGMTMR
jgi:hypothetical protein